ncbi:MAG: hypothetical protein ACOYIK_09905 [Coriobacteriales bacterium]|jgi:hypothetical protein
MLPNAMMCPLKETVDGGLCKPESCMWGIYEQSKGFWICAVVLMVNREGDFQVNSLDEIKDE